MRLWTPCHGTVRPSILSFSCVRSVAISKGNVRAAYDHHVKHHAPCYYASSKKWMASTVMDWSRLARRRAADPTVAAAAAAAVSGPLQVVGVVAVGILRIPCTQAGVRPG